MSKNIKKMLVPVLRFPEFRDAGGWGLEKLGHLVDTVTPVHKLPTALYQTEGQYPIFDQSQSYICGWTNNRDALINDNLPLIIFGDHTCVLKMAHEPFAQGADGIKILKAKKEIEILFLFQILQFKPVRMEEYKRHYSILKEKLVAFPKNETGEQQKIADCLSSIDALISAQSQKVEALKNHKKGLMQQLFTADGETIPRLRFPEFRDVWRKCELEKLIDLLSGYAFKSEFFSVSGNKLLTPKNFTKSGRANFNVENTKFTTENFDPKYICKEGDLLLLLTDLTPSCELLGKPIFLTKEDGDVLLNQRIVRVIPKEDIHIRFLLYFFSTDLYHKRIKNTATGSTVRHSSNKIVASTKIYFPSVNEQQKIADCLSCIDELISAQSQKVEALKTHKKGLMQQLFPATDDVNYEVGT